MIIYFGRMLKLPVHRTYSEYEGDRTSRWLLMTSQGGWKFIFGFWGLGEGSESSLRCRNLVVSFGFWSRRLDGAFDRNTQPGLFTFIHSVNEWAAMYMRHLLGVDHRSMTKGNEVLFALIYSREGSGTEMLPK